MLDHANIKLYYDNIFLYLVIGTTIALKTKIFIKIVEFKKLLLYSPIRITGGRDITVVIRITITANISAIMLHRYVGFSTLSFSAINYTYLEHYPHVPDTHQ